MRTALDALWTKTFRFEASHGGEDAKLFRGAIGGDHDAVAVSSAADPYRSAFQRRIQRDFAAREEAVGIDVQDAVGAGGVHLRRDLRDERDLRDQRDIVSLGFDADGLAFEQRAFPV